MKNSLVRYGLGAALVVTASAPMTAPAQAWSCMPPVVSVACLVLGTSCRAIDDVTGRGELCQLS